MITIHLLPVLFGDTILIDIVTVEEPSNTNILIDCGYNFNSELLPLLQKYHQEGKVIDRFIITHYDDDHIRSAAKLIKENGLILEQQIIKINQVWLNAYRHLQFKKRTLTAPDDKQIDLINAFTTIYNPDNSDNESNIGAKQASKLGRELYSKDYPWNEDFNNNAICIEQKNVVNITNQVCIKLLGPSIKQLSALEEAFKAALKEMGIPLSDTKLIDDAFELYSNHQSKESAKTYTGTVSSSSIPTITIEVINWLSKNSKYVADKELGNGSSIAFVLEVDDKRILMLADAHAEPIIEQLQALYPEESTIYFDAIKVAHHGSFSNNPKSLYDLIDSPLYLISTNGGHPSHVHPDLETIAFIINRPLRGPFIDRKLIFNYNPSHLAGIFNQQLMDHFHFSAEVSNKIELI